MLIKTCWKKDFFYKKNTHNQPKQLERRNARKTALLVEQGCKYSHIPTTVNQELLLDTRHVQEQCSAITFDLVWTTTRH